MDENQIITKEKKRLNDKYQDLGAFYHSELSELSICPSPFSFSLIKRLYAFGGPYEKALRKLGIFFDKRSWQKHAFLDTVFGELKSHRRFEEEVFSRRLSIKKFFFWPRIICASARSEIRFARELEKFKNFFGKKADEIMGLGKILDSARSDKHGKFIDSWLEAYEFGFLASLLLKKQEKKVVWLLGGNEYKKLARSFVLEKPKGLSKAVEAVLQKSDYRREFDFELAFSEPWPQSGLGLVFGANGFPFLEKYPIGKKDLARKAVGDLFFLSGAKEILRALFAFSFDVFRQSAHKHARKIGLKEKTDIAFLNLQEWGEGREAVLGKIEERKREREIFRRYCQSALSRSHEFESCDNRRQVFPVQVLSAGEVSGAASFEPDKENHIADKIILAPNLSPFNLIKYQKAKAFVLESGSPLMHAAILAREKKVPVFLCKNAVPIVKNGDKLLISAKKQRLIIEK
jgi:phosphohistidine swiveling domain-containing protein